MKNIEMDFVLVLENQDYATLHHIAKSNGLTVEKYLMKRFDEMVESWELGCVKNEITN